MKIRHSTVRFTALAAFLVIMGLTTPALSDMNTGMLRCGPEVIQTGDSMYMVKQRCGRPAEEKITGSVSSGSYGGGRREGSGSYQESNVQVTVMIYDCGSSDFVYKLTFLGDSLSNIQYLGRGSGPNMCQ
jgi:hypothetical protein